MPFDLGSAARSLVIAQLRYAKAAPITLAWPEPNLIPHILHFHENGKHTCIPLPRLAQASIDIRIKCGGVSQCARPFRTSSVIHYDIFNSILPLQKIYSLLILLHCTVVCCVASIEQFFSPSRICPRSSAAGRSENWKHQNGAP